MRTVYFILISVIIFSSGNLFAQDTLPAFTVKNSKGKISVSWQNNYSKEVKGITIQSSFDSLKKYSSLKTVPNPADAVNGFFDTDVPYDKMFYRLFIVFDSGIYIFTAAKRPDVDPNFDLQKNLAKLREANRPGARVSKIKEKNPTAGNSKISRPENQEGQPVAENEVKPEIKKEPVSYVSRYIYTGKDNNIVINLPDFNTNKYVVKFYDEETRSLFELNKITEGYLIVEKVNFLHAGWFFFEIYKNEVLLEKNKFYIPKD
ncbi:MAG: hypothetical protein ABIO79_04390 [Ferruginibacter sp.]